MPMVELVELIVVWHIINTMELNNLACRRPKRQKANKFLMVQGTRLMQQALSFKMR